MNSEAQPPRGLDLTPRQRTTVATALTILGVIVIIGAVGMFAWVVAAFLSYFSSVFLPLAVGGVVAMVFRPYYQVLQKTLPMLSPGASIVLAGSTAATRGTPAFGAYAASKAAIRSFGRTWATELADRGIRVNTVIPGPIMTPGLHGLEADEEQRQAMLDGLASNPMKRIGDPEELAAAVVFLASDASSFMTGSEVVVDGGINQV